MSTESIASTHNQGSCLVRIRSWATNASTAKGRIAKYILAKPETAQRLAIDELAERCNTSPSTVSRFCTDVGYSSYKELQIELATATALEQPTTLDKFDEKASPEQIIRNVFHYNANGLADTLKLLDMGVMTGVAEAIMNARRTILMGIGGSSIPAQEAKVRFISLGLTAVVADDPYEQIFLTSNVDKQDVVIGISHTGRTASVVEARPTRWR